MKFHIVRDGETIKDIIFLYSVTEDELKEDNRHIRSWDHLIPGTKLKISPVINADDHDILQMEPFIEDYYPKNIDISNEIKKEEVQDEPLEEVKINNEEEVAQNLDIVNNNSRENCQTILNVSEYYKKTRDTRNNYNIVYYPYYIYYPVYSPYFMKYKKGK